MADQQGLGGEAAEDEDGISWREVFKALREGQMVEVPTGDDQEFKRRQRQLERRAEKQGISLLMERDHGVLRVAVAQDAPAPQPAPDAAPERERRRERPERPERPDREERRAQRRAERAANG